MGEVKQLQPTGPSGKPVGRNKDGRFTKGHLNNRKRMGGRPKGSKLKEAIEGLYAEPPTLLIYQTVLDGLKPMLTDVLGREPTLADIPRFEENQQLQIWVFHVYAVHGSTEHAKELLDRVSPKPSRVSIDTTVIPRPPMAASGDESEKSARSYYDRLEGDGLADAG